MSQISSLYQPETIFDDYNSIAYNWGNSNHPETYQSFATTGKGLIDQSIFCFQRPKDAWSLGAYCTQFSYNGDSQSPLIERYTNNLGKINVMVNDWLPNNTTYLNSKYVIENLKYSPNPTMSGLSPWYNFAYNKYTLIPIFDMINPTTREQVVEKVYNEVMANYSGWRVKAFSIKVYGPILNYGINPFVIQWAGRLRNTRYETVGINTRFLFGDMDEGVYYIPHDRHIFKGFVVSQYGQDDAAHTSATVFADLTQWDMVDLSFSYMNLIYTTVSIEDVVKFMNRLGFYWGKDYDAIDSPKGINCTDPDVVCPVIDSVSHMVTDEVLSGTEIADYATAHLDDPFCNFLLDYGNLDENDNPIGFTTIEYRENYNPEMPTVEPAETIDLYPPTIATTGGNTIWLLSEDEVKLFFNYLWDPTGSEVENILHGLALLGENPMDFIVSLRMFPIKNLYSLTTHSLATICFGRYTSQLTSKAYLTSSNIIILDLGEFYFNDGGLQNDFRDYEPYTRYSLYIPFCGITSLNAIECINQTIDVKMIVDLSTGACTAVVYTNGVPYKYIDSNIGIEIPVVGRDMAGYAQTVMAAALGGAVGGGKIGEKPVKGQIERKNLAKDYQQISYDAKMWDVGDSFGATAGAAGGTAIALGAAAVVGGALISGTAAALATAPSIDKVGSSVPAVSIAEPLYCYFIVQRSECWIPENYNKLYGRPLNVGGKVSDFTGFSTFGNFKLEGISGATPEEKLLINDLLQAGIYI